MFASLYMVHSENIMSEYISPFGMLIIGITVAAGLFTWWVTAQDKKDKKE